MKTLKLILTATLLAPLATFANTAKVPEPTKKIYQVLEGDSIHIEGKKGLAVELRYKSEHVEVGEVSDVNITLSTALNTGTLKVKMSALENDLSGLEEKELKFELTTATNSFPINLQLTSATDGIHYINFVLSVEGQGSRVLAVPINVGTVSNKIENKALSTTAEGVAISVSSAEEEIK